MAGIGTQNGNTGKGAAPGTAAPTRSQVNQESKAPRAGWAAKPPPGAPARRIARPPPEEPSRLASNRRAEAGRRRADQRRTPVQSSEVRPFAREGREARPGPESDSAGGPQHSWRIPAMAAQVALALICAATAPSVHERRDESNANIALQSQPRPQARPPQNLSVPSPQTVTTISADEALTTALDDLDTALEAQPGRSPEELLRQVSTPDHDCMLAWHDHVPSLVFGKEPIGSNSLASTIQACANAVHRLR